MLLKNGRPKHPDHGFMHIFREENLPSEKGKIMLEIQKKFKISNNVVNKFTIQKKGQSRIF